LNEQQAYDLLKQIDQALLLQQWITAMRKKAIQNAKMMEIATEAGLQRQVKLTCAG
jgi:DNA-binding phage protein